MAFTASPHHVGLSVADLEAEQRWYQSTQPEAASGA
jgi:hypothetical protein